MIKTTALNKIIETIHPDDYPHEAKFLLKLILIVNRISRSRIKEVLKKALAAELMERSDASQAHILDALGINAPLRLVKTGPKPQITSPDRREAQPLPRQPSSGRGRKALTLVCTFGGCDRKHCSKGLCAGHYQQQKAGKTLTPLRPRLRPGESYRLTPLPSIPGKLTGDEMSIVNAFSASEEA